MTTPSASYDSELADARATYQELATEFERMRDEVERLRQVLDAAKSLVYRWQKQGYRPESDWGTPEARDLVTAINLASVSPA